MWSGARAGEIHCPLRRVMECGLMVLSIDGTDDDFEIISPISVKPNVIAFERRGISALSNRSETARRPGADRPGAQML